MRAGETKYKGEIMKRISDRRWKLGSNYLPSHVIAEVLDEAKQDIWEACVGWEDVIDEQTRTFIKRIYRFNETLLNQKLKKWFGEAEK